MRTQSQTLAPEEINRELEETDHNAPRDHDGDVLPFSQMSGARFELLTYLLLQAERSSSEQVTLVKVSGDKGRDVLTYSDGHLRRIVQCKNLQEPLSEPALVRELIKLALNAHLDDSLIPETINSSKKIAYEIMAPGGLTEPASKLVDEWPNSWSEERILKLFPEVIETFSAFKGLKWTDVQEAVVHAIPRKLTLEKSTALDISMRIRCQVAIYKRFFRGHVFADMEDIQSMLKNTLRSENWRAMDDEAMRNLVDRIEEFPKQSRMYLGHGTVFGPNAAFLARMTSEEFRQAVECAAMPATNLSILMADVSKRLIDSEVSLFQASAGALNNISFPLFLTQYATERSLYKIYKRGTPSFLKQAFPRELGDLDAEMHRLVRRNWDAYCAITSADFVSPSDDLPTERLRKNLAIHALRGFSCIDDFMDAALQDLVSHRRAVDQLLSNLDELLPCDVLVISDLSTPFRDPSLLNRLASTIRDIEANKKSQQISTP